MIPKFGSISTNKEDIPNTTSKQFSSLSDLVSNHLSNSPPTVPSMFQSKSLKNTNEDLKFLQDFKNLAVGDESVRNNHFDSNIIKNEKSQLQFTSNLAQQTNSNSFNKMNLSNSLKQPSNNILSHIKHLPNNDLSESDSSKKIVFNTRPFGLNFGSKKQSAECSDLISSSLTNLRTTDRNVPSRVEGTKSFSSMEQTSNKSVFDGFSVDLSKALRTSNSVPIVPKKSTQITPSETFSMPFIDCEPIPEKTDKNLEKCILDVRRKLKEQSTRIKKVSKFGKVVGFNYNRSKPIIQIENDFNYTNINSFHFVGPSPDDVILENLKKKHN